MANAEDMKIYEIGYLLVPFLPAEEVAKTVEKLIKSRIQVVGGEVASEIEPVMTRLAYPITKVINNKHNKFSDAYFGALRCKLAPADAVKFIAELAKEDDIIRELLISLPKGSEAIIAPRRVFARSSVQTGRDDKPFEIERVIPEKESSKPELSVEDLDKEIDKEIDKLVVEPAA